MSFTTALYERDGVIRFAPCVPAAVKPLDKNLGQVTKTRAVTQSPHSLGLGKRRTRRGAIQILIGAVWNTLRSLGLWIEEKSMDAHYRRVDSYLAQSSNHADLERRMRELDHSDRLNWIDCGSRRPESSNPTAPVAVQPSSSSKLDCDRRGSGPFPWSGR